MKTDDELMTKAQEKFQGFESSLRDNFNKLTEEVCIIIIIIIIMPSPFAIEFS